MSATSQWSPAFNVRCAVNGSPIFEDCEYSEDYSPYETTNLSSPTNPQGALHYEGGVDVVKTTFKGTLLCDKTNVKGVKGGMLYSDFSWTDDFGETHTGSLRILTRNKQGGVKGAFKLSFTGEFTGAVTGQ